MEKLEKAGLFGQGLMVVDKPELVCRYNDCLKEIGVSPTMLPRFSIDGMGWSPEIAEEKGDKCYLSHGAANQFAIILSPKQHRLPVYFLYYSFNRDLMDDVFSRYLGQLVDATSETAVWLYIDQDLSHFLSPMDLLMVDSIAVRISAANGLMEAAQKQKNMVARFMNTDDWFKPNLRYELQASASAYGDLRYRNLVIRETLFADIRSYHTLAFGGIYVIRESLKSLKHMLILENEAVSKNMGMDKKEVLLISDPSLIATLIKEGLVEISLKKFADCPEILKLKKDCIVVDALAAHRPDIKFEELDNIHKKLLAEDLKEILPKHFFELERLIKRLTKGDLDTTGLSKELKLILLQPAEGLQASIRSTVWQLLTHLCPLDVLQLYRHNKHKFFETYRSWPENKQNWAINVIEEKYISKMTEQEINKS